MLREDSEYPEWLWELLEPKTPLSELTPNTKQYWRRQRKEMARERNAKQALLG